MLPRRPRPTLFAYTTLFRSRQTRRFGPLHCSVSRYGWTRGSATWWHTARCRCSPRSSGTWRWCCPRTSPPPRSPRSEEHTSELQSLTKLVCRLLLEKKNNKHSDERHDSMPVRADPYSPFHDLIAFHGMQSDPPTL